MKLTLLSLLFLFLIKPSAYSQDKLSEKDLVGKWQMIIEMKEAMNEAKEELDDEEGSAFEKIILSATTSFVTSIIDNIEIKIEFFKDGKALVDVNAFDEEPEREYTTWKIVNNKLYLDDTKSFKSESSDYWVMKDGVLYSVEEDGLNKYVYMKSIKN